MTAGFRSDKIGALATAIAKAQQQIAASPAMKDALNSYGRKYADIYSVLRAALPITSANGIAVLQPPVTVEESGKIAIDTVLLHGESEQWIGSRLCVEPDEKTIHGIGSAITYMRRYALSSMLAIPTEDDDGAAAMGKGMEQARTHATEAALKREQSREMKWAGMKVKDIKTQPADADGVVYRVLVLSNNAHVYTADEQRVGDISAAGEEQIYNVTVKRNEQGQFALVDCVAVQKEAA